MERPHFCSEGFAFEVGERLKDLLHGLWLADFHNSNPKPSSEPIYSGNHPTRSPPQHYEKQRYDDQIDKAVMTHYGHDENEQSENPSTEFQQPAHDGQ